MARNPSGIGGVSPELSEAPDRPGLADLGAADLGAADLGSADLVASNGDDQDGDHRVRNLMASVQALAARSVRHAVSLEGFLESFLGRIDALTRAYGLLSAANGRDASLDQLSAAFLGHFPKSQVAWSGPNIAVTARSANALALALHELSANAQRVGALSNGQGRVDLTWRATAEGGFVLEWIESGGPPAAKPETIGFGLNLIEQVTGRELGGVATMTFRPEGFHLVLQTDAAAVSSPAAPAAGSEPGATLAGEDLSQDLTLALKGLRVLIVEDSALLALELEAGLSEAGAQVIGVAGDLEQARRLAGRNFEVAVLDANLNGQSVLPVAEILSRNGVPFIFATGYRDTLADTERFAVPVVRKPYNVRQIATALVEAIGPR